MGLKLRVLYLGKMEFPRFRLVECDNEATMVVSPAVALLIQHPTLGNILYDTGNSADFLKTYTPEMLHNYPITEMITIEEALAKEGLTPGDIDQLILSHLHFDHAGRPAALRGHQGHRPRPGLRGRLEAGLVGGDHGEQRGLHPLPLRRGGHPV